MIEFLIENITIDSRENRENFLDKLEGKLVEEKQEFVILESKKFDFIKTKELVNEIKKHFDIFIILKTELPKRVKELEYFFSTGIHGIFFLDEEIKENSIEILQQAVRIFSTGTVFYQTPIENKNYINGLIESNIIPVIKSGDGKLLEFIELNLNKKKSLRGYLKFIPLIEEFSEDYSFNLIRENGFKEKVEKKIILELNNLRQKLMIKEIEESFNSSSL